MSLKDYFASAPTNFSANWQFSRTFVKMWIAGTMGAYFTFLFRNLAADVPTFSLFQIDCGYTFYVWVRYAYLFWFLAYFFASNVRHEGNQQTISKWDIWFNVAQALASFGAAYYLGFLTRGGDATLSGSTSCAVGAANAAIAIICMFSLIGFGYRSADSAENRTLNRLRWVGFWSSMLALGAVVLASCIGEGYRTLAFSGAALFGLGPFIALMRFVLIEWKRISPPPAASNGAAA